jgi:hypothetical protein
MYHRVNPAMERYMTHLLPFMLIPASYGIYSLFAFVKQEVGCWILDSRLENIIPINYLTSRIKNQESNMMMFIKTFCYLLLTTLFFYQIFITFRGLRDWGDKTWYQMSYDEKSARILSENAKKENIILLTSLPESYYYFSKKSTQSVSNHFPFVDLDRSPPNRVVWVVLDMGMRDLFPKFTSNFEKNLSGKKVTTYRVHIPYHFGAKSLPETASVTVYRTTVGELKKNN